MCNYIEKFCKSSGNPSVSDLLRGVFEVDIRRTVSNASHLAQKVEAGGVAALVGGQTVTPHNYHARSG